VLKTFVMSKNVTKKQPIGRGKK